MRRYALFLRGINVGKIRVPMPQLKALLEGFGCTGIQTWLATGNVVLASALDEAELKTTAQRELSQAFNYDAYVLVRDPNTLAALARAYPFGESEAHHRYVVLCEPGVGEQVLTVLTDAGGPAENEQIALAASGDVYWQCPKGSSTTSTVAKVLSRASAKRGTTTRNLNTIEKMVEAIEQRG